MPSRLAMAAFMAALWGPGFVVGDRPLSHDADKFDDFVESSGGAPTQTFHSSDVVAPVFQVNEWIKNETDPGYLFLGFRYPDHDGGPMIFDSKDLSLVYADQGYSSTFSSNMQELNGEPYLTCWEGENTRGHANGFALMFNENYELVYNITTEAMEGSMATFADFHEMRVTRDNTVLVTVYFKVNHRDLTSIGGKEDSTLLDSGFQEIDPVTNEVLFKWAASDHFSVNHTKSSNDNDMVGLDFAHINSIDKDEDGNYLVSSRHMGLVTLLDGKTGDPIWILGGKENQFEDLSDGEATNIAWQHDVRFYKNSSHITMFDNHRRDNDYCQLTESADNPCTTRILHLELDTDHMTARVVRSFHHPQHVNAEAMGGVQVLENGNIITAWGYNPSIVEYKSDGTVVMDIQRGRIARHIPNVSAYRAHKGHWKGMPKTKPGIASKAPDSNSLNATVWLSWNGATEVDKWAVLGTDDADGGFDHTNVIADSPRKGFETTIQLGDNHEAVRYIAGAAIDSSGKVLGSTYIMDLRNGDITEMHSDIKRVGSQEETPSWPSAGGYAVGGLACALGGIGGLALYLRRRRMKKQEPMEEVNYSEVKQMDEDELK